MTNEALLALLHDLSLDEKIAQLCQIDMSTFLADAGSPTGPMLEFNLTREQIVSAGSLICGANADADKFAEIHETIRRESKHGIPPLIMSDVIHGMRTTFPIPLALGSSFDEATAEEMARVSAQEASACGVHVTFSPMLDVCRDPRWGRCMESPGEAPALCGAMGAAMVRGYRGKDLKDKGTMATCAKHYAGYAACEAGRDYAPVDISRTEMYNTYLPPFKETLDAGCDLLMPAFTPMDRVPAAANRWLMKDILRERWGWDGVAITDWSSVGELYMHHMATDAKDASVRCFKAGTDMDMMSFAFFSGLKEAVEDGTVSMAEIDASVLRVLELKNKLGLFEDPNHGANGKEQMAMRGRKEHREAALRAALKSCVLLKNDGVLPLNEDVNVCLAGDHADTHRLLGSWQADGREEETPSLRVRFTEDARIRLVDVDKADVIIYAVGEDQDDVGESASKLNPALTLEQKAELEKLLATGKPVVMVLFCGRPLMIEEEAARCNAVLNAWFPGSEGAMAIKQLLMGDVNPSGHLSMTFPKCVGQIPIHHDQLSTGRPTEPENGRFISVYRDGSNKPLYPFGYGLSYTTFAFSKAAVSSDEMSASTPVTFTVKVANTGKVAGETVVQLYYRGKRVEIMAPLRTLKAWKRISLQPGEETEVSFTVSKEDLRMWDYDGMPVEAAGVYDFFIGESSMAELSASIMVK